MARIIKEQTLLMQIAQIFLVKFFWPLVLLIIIITFFIEYSLVISPKIKQLSGGGIYDVKGYGQVLTEQTDYLAKLKNLKTQADAINQSELEKLGYVLANRPEMPALLNQIDVLSKQSGLELTDFGVTFGEGVIRTNLSFKGGTYQVCKQYLDNLEKNIRVMDVAKIEMSNIGNGISLAIHSYYMSE